MTTPVIKTGTATVSNGTTVINFDSAFLALPTVVCTPKVEDINIYVKNIALDSFTVSASVTDTFEVDYIAIKE